MAWRSRTSSTIFMPRPPGPPDEHDLRLCIVFLPDGRLMVRISRNEEAARRVSQKMWERGWRLSEAEPEDEKCSLLWFVRRAAQK